MTNLPLEPLVTAKEAARLLGVSERTLWALRSGGQLPAVAIGSRCVRFRPQDIRAFVEARLTKVLGRSRRQG